MIHTPKSWFDVRRRWGSEAIKLSNEDVVKYVRQCAGKRASEPAALTSLAREIGFSMSWAKSGFAKIDVGARLFASLCCTSVPPDLLPDIGMPWDTFIIQIPDGLEMDCDFGWGPQKLRYMSYEAVPGTGGGNFSIRPLGSPGAGIKIGFHKLGELLAELDGAKVATDADNIAPWQKDSPDPVVEPGDRTLMYRRAFVGACIEMMSPANAAARAMTASGFREKHGAPRSWTFQLTRNVQIDCRERVRDILQGRSTNKRSAPGVQVLVRGHWKRQPFGEGRAERKFIHIEPYWRGPEDAPIAVRSHVLKRDDDAAE